MSSSRKRLLAALCCGIAAALLLMWYAHDVRAQASLSRAQALATYGGEQIEVAVATRDIAAGETLDAANVSLQLWLADLLPAGVVCNTTEVFGKTTSVALLKNEPVVRAKLGEAFAKLTVPEGLCALSVPVDDVQAVGGALVPGTAVDVYAVGATGVALVVQDVLVLETSNGFGISATGTGSGAFGASSARASLKWVTLAVAPRNVQDLLSAARDKHLFLVLPGEDVVRGSASVGTVSDSAKGIEADGRAAQDLKARSAQQGGTESGGVQQSSVEPGGAQQSSAEADQPDTKDAKERS
jgi:pilus assembly protein CpaB